MSEKDEPTSKNPFREAILEQIAQRDARDGRTISPEDAARAVSAQHWHKLLKDVKAEAIRMAQAGEIAIYRKGKPVDPTDFKGVYRLGKPAAEKA